MSPNILKIRKTKPKDVVVFFDEFYKTQVIISSIYPYGEEVWDEN